LGLQLDRLTDCGCANWDMCMCENVCVLVQRRMPTNTALGFSGSKEKPTIFSSTQLSHSRPAASPKLHCRRRDRQPVTHQRAEARGDVTAQKSSTTKGAMTGTD
ncbi:hypothetical protein CLAIMM_08908, partial [Cladophialophora immunda]